MLVNKPHADQKKPLAGQYRLVHNYLEVKKNIAPCSYPLRHLYKMLDEVASVKVYSVLDLSQGFFQQHLETLKFADMEGWNVAKTEGWNVTDPIFPRVGMWRHNFLKDGKLPTQFFCHQNL